MRHCFLCGQDVDNYYMLHDSCIKKIFNVSYIPKTNLCLSDISKEAQKMVGKISISGVGEKLFVKLNKHTKEIELAKEKSEYILKPQVSNYKNLPQSENLCMTLASYLGIDVPVHTLIKLKDNTWAYIVKRFDIHKGKKMHQEDFSQILDQNDKYYDSFEEIGSKLKEISDVPGLDVQLFYERILFNFIIGNGDVNFKNFSITYGTSGNVRLSKAYDLISSKLVIPDEEDFALTLNGKRNKITANDFIEFADYLKIPRKIAEYMFLDKEEQIKHIIKNSVLDKQQKIDLINIVEERFRRLK